MPKLFIIQISNTVFNLEQIIDLIHSFFRG